MYKHFLYSPTGDKWRKIGLKRRAGIACPLFSIYSANSWGIGDFSDLKLLIDWCAESGLSIIQLLPLNDLGWDYSPYNAVSSFALEPAYLHLRRDTINRVSTGMYIDYKTKAEKLKYLWQSFRKIYPVNDKGFDHFKSANEYWLNEYAEFRVQRGNSLRKEFHKWVQWQVYEQMCDVKRYAEKKGILLMGDLPLLVGRNSADVWAHPEYFKKNLSAGAPPDMFHKSGQNWGMPPYNWEKIEEHGWVYVKNRLKYAENFYHLFRIDHFIGLFRLWTFDRKKKGKFDPAKESEWEEQGKRILDAMLSSTSMLPTAEDLGTVPACSLKVLNEYSICGTDWQRTLRTSNGTFLPHNMYRENSSAMISLHDSSMFAGWWNYEISDKEKRQFVNRLHGKPKFLRKCAPELVRSNLETINRSSSIFSIQMLQDYLCLDENLLKKMSGRNYRINTPGTIHKRNWTLRLPLSLEKLLESKLSEQILEIVKGAGRY